MVKKLLIAALAGLFASCKTYDFGGMLAAGSTAQERFENSIRPADRAFHPEKVESAQAGYRFRVASDLHIEDGDWGRLGNLLSSAESDHALLMVLLGDYMYEAGVSLERLADSLRSRAALRVFPAIGNHEVYRDGYQRNYRPVFGATCYSFTVEAGGVRDLFVVLDSANGTLGTGQFGWLQSLLGSQRPGARHCFVFTHANFFAPSGYLDVISTYPVEEQMKLLDIFARNSVTAVFTGHSHQRDETTVRGVRYVTVGSWGQDKRRGEYCGVECTPDGSVGYGFGTAE